MVSIRGDNKNQKRIMKKEYIKPEMLVEEILLSSMLAVSAPVTDTEGDGDYANERRGGWGDLWN